ncbi:MAG TPA: enoyl-CoA hydratase [Candidatus Binataceae bacterium]|nr:enoyl-CoA hydratase [Candidatus Binataceae bacterium]
MAGILLREESEGVALLTMNQPERRNPLSSALMLELREALQEIGARPELRAVLLAGAGPAFSAGHDLVELQNRDSEFYRWLFDLCCDLMTTVQTIAQPVIAVVGGVASAAGCQLAATCDLVIAAQSASFATPGVRIGLFCSTPMVALTRAIGAKRAMEMLLSGQPISAAVAYEWGLVNRVVADDALLAQSWDWARRIAQASPLALAIGKEAFYRQIEMDQASAYAYTKEVMSRNAMAADAQEGFAAFLNKRSPRWQGR